jgi:hypothetical protein
MTAHQPANEHLTRFSRCLYTHKTPCPVIGIAWVLKSDSKLMSYNGQKVLVLVRSARTAKKFQRFWIWDKPTRGYVPNGCADYKCSQIFMFGVNSNINL